MTASIWPVGAQLPPDDVGRPPTAEEVKPWDLTLPPDGHGLPPGSRTAALGQTIDVEQTGCAPTACPPLP
jgi:hypothetical protein